jgi:transglutaminase/protease-like cytokinesis protein 3
MTTEREYQEWQRHRPRRTSKPKTGKFSPKPKKRSWWPGLWLGLGLGAAGLAFWGNPHLGRSFPSLKSLPSLEQLAQPKTLILTKRVSNPSPGTPQSLPASSHNRLDAIAASVDYRGNSVTALAQKLAPYASTEADKARLIYSWIAQHIAYDVPMAVNNQVDDLRPETVLQRRQTICSGYANLYQAIAQALGLEAVIVEGYAKGVGGLVGTDNEINHAWNGVKIDGKWYLLDTTWGAGTVDDNVFQPRFSPYYFATPPAQLIYTHFPRESQWQLLPTVYSRTQFDRFPEVKPRFFRDQLGLVSHLNPEIQAQGNLEILLDSPTSTLLAAQLRSASGVEIAKNYTLTQKKDRQNSVQVAFPAPGNYKLIIFSKQPQESQYQQAVTYDITASDAGTPFPTTYSTFSDRRSYLQMPLTQNLPVNSSTFFQLEVNNATKVLVINEANQDWTELSKNGSFFSGTALIKPGKTLVIAQFPDSDKYWTLLEYN